MFAPDHMVLASSIPRQIHLADCILLSPRQMARAARIPCHFFSTPNIAQRLPVRVSNELCTLHLHRFLCCASNCHRWSHVAACPPTPRDRSRSRGRGEKLRRRHMFEARCLNDARRPKVQLLGHVSVLDLSQGNRVENHRHCHYCRHHLDLVHRTPWQLVVLALPPSKGVELHEPMYGPSKYREWSLE